MRCIAHNGLRSASSTLTPSSSTTSRRAVSSTDSPDSTCRAAAHAQCSSMYPVPRRGWSRTCSPRSPSRRNTTYAAGTTLKRSIMGVTLSPLGHRKRRHATERPVSGEGQHRSTELWRVGLCPTRRADRGIAGRLVDEGSIAPPRRWPSRSWTVQELRSRCHGRSSARPVLHFRRGRTVRTVCRCAGQRHSSGCHVRSVSGQTRSRCRRDAPGSAGIEQGHDRAPAVVQRDARRRVTIGVSTGQLPAQAGTLRG